jgi:DNA polymerase III subunit beta
MSRIVVDRAALAAAVAFASRALPRNATIPTLNGMRLSGGKKLKVSAFDYETYAEAHVLNGSDDEVDVLLPGRAFGQYLTGMSGDMVSIEVDGSAAVVTCGRAKVTLRLMSLADYPTAPTAPPVLGSIPAQMLTSVVASLRDCADPKNAREALRGIGIQFGPQVTFTATDRYRGAVCTVDWTGEADLTVCAPIPILEASKVLVDNVQIGCDENLLSVSDGDKAIIGRLFAGTSPPMTKLIDDLKEKTSALVDRDEAIATVGWLASGDNRKNGSLCLVDFETDSLTFSLAGGESIDAQSSIDAKVDGEPLTVKLNAVYLLSVLKASPAPTCLLSFSGPTKPLKLTSEDDPGLRCVVMPVRQ